ncbi:cytoadherence linked asexual protein 8 [Plasmodium sp. DRC-Itaito]|nr:cytoadherence linked asexual protein 8 [Plasmodium sp. DRC-Itaito]
MISYFKVVVFLIFFFQFLKNKVICSINESENVNENLNEDNNLNEDKNINDNIYQLKFMIANDELHKNLTIQEKLILDSLENDKLKFPLVKHETETYLDISKFKKKSINDADDDMYIIPTIQSSFYDIAKYEHLLKEQLIESYTANISDLIKKKLLIVRTLKTIKLMFIPLNSYKQKNNLKTALEELNEVFKNNVDQSEKNRLVNNHREAFKNILNVVDEIEKSKEIINKGETLILGNSKIDLMSTNDFFFTTNTNIKFMEELDNISKQYGLGLINQLGPHLIALGHFMILKLALKYYNIFFELKSVKFFSWQQILNFNMSDRYKILDMMCDQDAVYYSQKKRRKTYMKVDRSNTSMECNILEFLIHFFNKYQLEIIKITEDTDFDLHGMMEHRHIRDRFFSYMCNDPKECIIYHTDRFKKEKDEEDTFQQQDTSHNISAYNLYLNFYYFMKRYSSYGIRKTTYVHLLNLTGLINYDIRAYVTSLYLPGYYNIIEMSFTEETELPTLFYHSLECIKKCYLDENNEYTLFMKNTSIDSNFINEVSKCDLCKGAFLYANLKYDNVPSMLQKFYIYVTQGLKLKKVTSLVRTLDIYQDYSNFLSHDVNWYTFLFLFRITSFQEITQKNVVESLYLNLKDEDSFHRSVTTSYWFPSHIKKYYTLHVRKHLPNNLLDELLKLMRKSTIEKMKKSITFLVHVNSFLQLDFFHNLNEPPFGFPRTHPLSLILEHKFKEWMDGSPAGFYFSNYQNPYIRKELHNRVLDLKFEPPKINEWNKVLKIIIKCAYEMYFEQRHVKNLFKYHNIHSINNKIMLMRDTYDMFNRKDFDDLLFFADIINIRKYLTATPLVKKGMDRTFYVIHSILGNSVNFYKYGIIYGFKVNKEILKEVVDELFSIYNFNTDIFTDTSFLQTVYLLFRKIEDTYKTQRRNDRMSINNIFFMNVANNYSKLSSEQRELEIHNSMASRFYSKTMFSAFQMLFSTMLSNEANHLDKVYGKSGKIGIATSVSAYLTFAYVYNGSIMDSLTNSLLPPYAKKPITQLKYGKTFVFSNYFMLASKMYEMLNYKNLSLLCEYQAVVSANYYSSKKVDQFLGRKFFPLTTTFLYMRIKETSGFGSTDWYKFFGKWDNNNPAAFLYFHFFLNLYFDSGKYFPGGFSTSLREQTEHVTKMGYIKKPSVQGFTQSVFLQLTNIVMYALCFMDISQIYAYFENVNFYIISNIRFLERYFNIFNKYFIDLFRRKLKEYTSDVLLKYEYETYINIRKRGYLDEAMESRIAARNKIKEYLYDNDENIKTNLRRYAMENMHKINMSTYVDDYIFFDDCDKNEEFLNDRCNMCPVYEESDEDNQKDLSSNSMAITRVKYRTTKFIDYKKFPEEASVELSEEENSDDDMNLTDNALMITNIPQNE